MRPRELLVMAAGRVSHAPGRKEEKKRERKEEEMKGGKGGGEEGGVEYSTLL